MSTVDHGENLIFLLSQPRAGSTLLQRMLGTHPAIHTVGEPWLLLPLLYLLRSKGIQAEYDAWQAHLAVKAFLKELPDGEDEYFKAVRCMVSNLYKQAQSGTKTRYFLDKTPRYYYIIPELVQTFPEARFIILLRNPLAVFCSRLRPMLAENRLFQLRDFGADDFLLAPALLLAGIDLLGERAVTLRYEDLLNTPEAGLQILCRYLDIEFLPQMVDYGSSDLSQWKFGDKTTVYNRQRTDPAYADRWLDTLRDPQGWRLVSDYLEMLGPDTIGRMGYSYPELRQTVESCRPVSLALRSTWSLKNLLAKRAASRRRWEWWVLRAGQRLQKSLGQVRHFDDSEKVEH